MSITLGSWLHAAEKHLKNAGIDTARLDCLVLLSDELLCDKSWVLAHPEHILQIEQTEKLDTKIIHRARHTPLAYIRGHAEFYGRDFIVNTDVLVPRSESEDMIDLLKQVMTSDIETVYDIGTGSGVLAITIKLEFPRVTVIATDIDNTCLGTAQKNALILGADVAFIQGDLLQPIRDSRLETRDSIFLANLPYVPSDYPVNKAATYEPSLALYSGPDGLGHYRTLFTQLTTLTKSPTHVITESLQDQHGALAGIAEHNGYSLALVKGLAQLFARA